MLSVVKISITVRTALSIKEIYSDLTITSKHMLCQKHTAH